MLASTCTFNLLYKTETESKTGYANYCICIKLQPILETIKTISGAGLEGLFYPDMCNVSNKMTGEEKNAAFEADSVAALAEKSYDYFDI